MTYNYYDIAPNISAFDASTNGADGSSATFESGLGANGTGVGGGKGGACNITASAGGNGNLANAGGDGGSITISCGAGGTTATGIAGVGGSLTLNSGDGGLPTGAGTGSAGGAISITAGLGTLAATGGAITLTGGAGGATGIGGAITLTAGAGGSTSGAGGGITFITGTSTSGAGGNFSVTTSAGGTAGQGGDFIFALGAGAGGSRQGVFRMSGANDDVRWKMQGTGVFRVEDSASTTALTFDHNGTNGLIDTTTGNVIVGASSRHTQISGRLLQTQGADIASATNLTLGSDGNSFEITGITTIDLILITNWQNGSKVTLIFNESLTVRHGIATSGSNVTILLSGAANFSATANDTLTLILSETTAGG